MVIGYTVCFTTGENRHEKYFQSDFMNNYGMKKLTYLVKTFKPDIIVNTFPMLVVPEFRKKTGLKIPVVNVLTDYGLHKNWLHKEVDKYYVASENLKFDIMEKGISKNKIKVTAYGLILILKGIMTGSYCLKNII